MSKSAKKGQKPQQNKELDVKAEKKSEVAVDTEAEEIKESEDIEESGKAAEEVKVDPDKELKDSEVDVEENETESEEEDSEDPEEEADPEVEEAEEDAEKDPEKESEEDKEYDAKSKSKASEEKTKSEDEIKQAVANAKFRKLPFIEKCKRDPLIPVSVLLAFVAVIIGIIFLVLPNITTPTMGITLEEFRLRFNNAEIAAYQLQNGSDIGFRTPAYVNPKETPTIIGDKATYKASGLYADFFKGSVSYYNSIGLEGATRKNDGELAYVDVFVAYDPDTDNGDQYNGVWIYVANTLEALYPDLEFYPAMNLASEKLGEFSNGDTRYYVRGDYAFRLLYVKNADTGYIIIDIVPKSTLNASQIRETIEITPETTVAAGSETVAPSETVPAST